MKAAFKQFKHQAFQREASQVNGRQAVEEWQKKITGKPTAIGPVTQQNKPIHSINRIGEKCNV